MTVDGIVDIINESLTVEEKAEVISKLLGKNSGLSVVWGSQNINVGTNIHINVLSPELMANLLDAVAQRIRNSDPQPPETSKNDN